MYYADGIDLTQTEFDELKFVLSCGSASAEKVRARTEADPTLARAYRKLFDCKLVTCAIVWGGTVLDAAPTRNAHDWLASYEKNVKDANKLSRREIMLAVWNTVGGAIAGGLVAWALFAAFGIGG